MTTPAEALQHLSGTFQNIGEHLGQRDLNKAKALYEAKQASLLLPAQELQADKVRREMASRNAPFDFVAAGFAPDHLVSPDNTGTIFAKNIANAVGGEIKGTQIWKDGKPVSAADVWHSPAVGGVVAAGFDPLKGLRQEAEQYISQAKVINDPKIKENLLGQARAIMSRANDPGERLNMLQGQINNIEQYLPLFQDGPIRQQLDYALQRAEKDLNSTIKAINQAPEDQLDLQLKQARLQKLLNGLGGEGGGRGLTPYQIEERARKNSPEYKTKAMQDFALKEYLKTGDPGALERIQGFIEDQERASRDAANQKKQILEMKKAGVYDPLLGFSKAVIPIAQGLGLIPKSSSSAKKAAKEEPTQPVKKQRQLVESAPGKNYSNLW